MASLPGDAAQDMLEDIVTPAAHAASDAAPPYQPSDAHRLHLRDSVGPARPLPCLARLKEAAAALRAMATSCRGSARLRLWILVRTEMRRRERLRVL